MSDEKAVEVFKIYCALKAHFTTESYDYIERQGRIAQGASTFHKRNDKAFFYRVANKFTRRADVIAFFVSNLLSDSEYWIGDDHAFAVFDAWKGRMAGLDYQIKDDLSHLATYLQDKQLSAQQLVTVVPGKHPALLRMYMGRLLLPETMAVLAHEWSVFDHWNSVPFLSSDAIYKRESMKIRKYIRFLNIDDLCSNARQQIANLTTSAN